MPHLPVEERREQLLAAAWRVLSSRGLAAATTRAVCAEAGLSQGAFHYCFASRDEMLRELATGLLPSEISAAAAVIDRRGSLAHSIGRALRAYWDLVEADPGAHQVLYEITTVALRNPAGRDLAELQYARYLDGARQVLLRVADVRRITWQRPLDVLARQVVTVLDGLTLHFAVDRDARAARAALDAFAHDLAAAGRPGRAAVPAAVPAAQPAVPAEVPAAVPAAQPAVPATVPGTARGAAQGTARGTDRRGAPRRAR